MTEKEAVDLSQIYLDKKVIIHTIKGDFTGIMNGPFF